jgi:hypothetical protein
MHASVLAVLSIIMNDEISIPLACSNEHVIYRAARNGPGGPGLASGLSNRSSSHRDTELGATENAADVVNAEATDADNCANHTQTFAKKVGQTFFLPRSGSKRSFAIAVFV